MHKVLVDTCRTLTKLRKGSWRLQIDCILCDFWRVQSRTSKGITDMLHENYGLPPRFRKAQSEVSVSCAKQGAPLPVESSFWHWTCQWVYGNIMEHLQEGIFLPFLPMRNVMHRIITPQINKCRKVSVAVSQDGVFWWCDTVHYITLQQIKLDLMRLDQIRLDCIKIN